MEIPATNAFRVIFPRYTELLNTGNIHTSEDIETFVRDELPGKI